MDCFNFMAHMHFIIVLHRRKDEKKITFAECIHQRHCHRLHRHCVRHLFGQRHHRSAQKQSGVGRNRENDIFFTFTNNYCLFVRKMCVKLLSVSISFFVLFMEIHIAFSCTMCTQHFGLTHTPCWLCQHCTSLVCWL